MAEVGVQRVSVEGVAAAAGVSKATVYRWWSSKGMLVLDAMEARFGILTAPHIVPSTGALRTDLYELMRPISDAINMNGRDRVWAQIVAEAQADAALAEIIFPRLVSRYRESQGPIFEAAVARGELSADADIDLLLDVLYGAYYHRLLLHHGQLDQGVFQSMVDIVLDGVLVDRKL